METAVKTRKAINSSDLKVLIYGLKRTSFFMDLSHLEVEDCDLRDMCFNKEREKVDFTGTHLTNVILDKWSFINSKFADMKLNNVRLNTTSFTCSNVNITTFENCHFENCEMTQFSITSDDDGPLTIKNCIFEDCNLYKANLNRHTYQNCKFLNCDWRKAKFNRAVFIDCEFDIHQYDSDTQFENATINGVDMRRFLGM